MEEDQDRLELHSILGGNGVNRRVDERMTRTSRLTRGIKDGKKEDINPTIGTIKDIEQSMRTRVDFEDQIGESGITGAHRIWKDRINSTLEHRHKLLQGSVIGVATGIHRHSAVQQWEGRVRIAVS